ncbi:MAG: DNA internalization-related competence protein ComEC/Rec2 [Colwellia sp.]|nr:DNA internalization-related competence protein ComEC/Rec2 [Colwellia sp.]
MDWWLASFFLGSILSLFIPIVPDVFVLFLLILLSITLFWYKPLRLSSGLFFGASWMLCNAFNYQSLWQENNLNSLELAATPQWVQGKVIGLQSSTDPTQINRDKKPLRFNLNVSHLNSKELITTIKIRLSWKDATFAVQQGQVVKLKVKFKPAHGLANIGGFSYQAWLRSKRILATGYVINDKNNNVLITKNSIRQQIFNTYKSLLPEHELSPLLLALGFGSRNELNQQLWQVLQTTGTGHLIAISGLHIGLVATGSYFIIMLFIRLLPLSHGNQLHFFQTLNIRYFVIAISLGVGIIYGYLAGFSLPTIRALLMLTLYWFSRVLSLHISIKRWLLLTLFLLTLTTPFSLFTASFWLSVYAVTIIFLTLWRFKNILNSGNSVWRFIKGLFVIQLSLTVMLLPISAVFFEQVSLVSLLANLVAVPWMSFFSIPLCLLSVLVMPFSESLSQFLMMCCIDNLQVLWHYLSYFSEQTWAVVKLSNVNIQLFILLGIMSVFYLFFQLPVINRRLINYQIKYMRKFFVAISVSVLLFFIFKTSALNTKMMNVIGTNINEQGSANDIKWQLVVFDVGQGLSVLIQQGSKTILYDTGAAYPSGFTMANAVILPYLQHIGAEQLDKMIISHSDNDHSGGLTEIQESMVINELFYNGKKAAKNAVCLQGKSFVWHNLHVKMLWPKNIVSEENDDSCVLLISDGKHKVLLTGDISKKVEAAILQQYPELTADILIVPHHGSKTSSSDLFLTKLQPSFAVVSAGYLNRWHMPVTEVVKRYQQHNIELLNTAKSGQIIFTMSEQGISKQSYYRDLWPFWFAH